MVLTRGSSRTVLQSMQAGLGLRSFPKASGVTLLNLMSASVRMPPARKTTDC